MELWQSKLNDGEAEAAWDLFAERYRALILATIRRLVTRHDDVMDVFSTVCEALAANDFRRLRQYSEQSVRRARVSTWLLAVVRNLTVDWLRARDGRRQLTVPDTLSALHKMIYTAVCIEGRSHVETYEIIRARTGSPMPFHTFLREVRATQITAPCPGISGSRPVEDDTDPADLPAPAIDPLETADFVQQVAAALATQPPDVRLAVELFVVERMAAADVARVVGWPTAKSVYNRVYRALAALRADLEGKGIGPGDL